jgi:23S rRNA pseudouridine2604 synthase
MSETGVRLNKYLADQGVASRREADGLIAGGRVKINGKTAVIGQKVMPGDDVVVNQKNLKEKVYLAYYKGRGIITHSPDEQETDIATRLYRDYKLKDVYPVGRLDKDSEGLMIITNDGRVTAPLLDPESETEKEYEVEVDKNINNFLIKHMTAGVKIERYTTKPAIVKKISDKHFTIILKEGKKHQIRRMCAALGYQIQSLKRTRIMNIELGKLKPNQYRILKDAELAEFLKQLDIKN